MEQKTAMTQLKEKIEELRDSNKYMPESKVVAAKIYAYNLCLQNLEELLAVEREQIELSYKQGMSFKNANNENQIQGN